MDKSQWQFRPVFIALLVVTLGVFLILPNLATTGKLRGNASALHLNRTHMILWKSKQANSPNFDFWRLSLGGKRRTIVLGLNLETSFKTNFVWQSDKEKKEIVIVCGKEFDNVPRSPWTFFLKNRAHAVGYSDGTTGLISPTEYTNLNFSGFVSASSLATNSELNIFGK
jgi:hypothetical protein